MGSSKGNATRDLYPIQVVSRRTGLSADVLRAWERRYGAVSPVRAGSGNRRVYSAEDIERLSLLKRLLEGGRSIGQIAKIPTGRLRKMLREDEQAVRTSRERDMAGRRAGPLRAIGRHGAVTDPSEHVRACLAALEDLDGPALESALERATLDLGRIAATEKVFLPLMTEIGERWRSGRLRILHEHLASVVVRTLLTGLFRDTPRRRNAPILIVATPSGQAHEFGALVVAATACTEGWDSVYLGPGLPAEEIAAAARRKKAAAVALSLVHPPSDPDVTRELLRLREMLPEPTAILVGGAASASYDETLREIGALCPDGMVALREELDRLQTGDRSVARARPGRPSRKPPSSE